ncbi:hypothetical protein DFH27DRAFT_649192 [Peziza echinospora]|nr:hypothetical protein DFH27DRAFT_649192 [Peziza echinospora]
MPPRLSHPRLSLLLLRRPTSTLPPPPSSIIPAITTTPRTTPSPQFRSYASARPSPRVRASPRAGQNAPQPIRYDDKDFPIEAFMAAYKSKAIPLNTLESQNLIKRYIALRGDSSHESSSAEEHGRILCDEFKITPPTLSFIGFILLRSTPPQTPLHRLSKHLLDLSSQLHDPAATIFLYRNTLLSANPSSSAATSIAANAKYLNRLAHIALHTHDPNALYVYAQYIHTRSAGFGVVGAKEKRAKAVDEDDALKIYVKAGEGGVGMGWVKAAEIVESQGRRGLKGVESESEEQQKERRKTVLEMYTKAAELQVPEAYVRLAEIESPYPAPTPTPPTTKNEIPGKEKKEESNGNTSASTSSPTIPQPPQPLDPKTLLAYETNLTKAASSGHEKAMFLLYKHNLATHNLPMAKEWLTVAAHAGYLDAMKALAAWFGEREGKAALQKEWEEAVDERVRVLGQKRAMGIGRGEEALGDGGLEGVVG